MDKIITPKIKKALLEELPEEAIPKVEEACQVYRFYELGFCTLPPFGEIRRYVDKLIEALEDLFQAKENLDKIITEMPYGIEPLISSKELKLEPLKSDPGIQRRITSAEVLHHAVLKDLVFPRKTANMKAYIFVEQLIDIYRETTGEIPYRQMEDTGPIHRIVAALAPALGCGTLAGIIRTVLGSMDK